MALFLDAYDAGFAIGIVFLVPHVTETPTVVALTIAVAEIAFPLWLLVKGVAVQPWQRRAAGLPGGQHSWKGQA